MHGVTSWIDAPRTILAAIAAVLAALGAMAANADDAMGIASVAARVFTCEAVMGTVLALLSSRGRWSHRRRAQAGGPEPAGTRAHSDGIADTGDAAGVASDEQSD